MLIDASSSKILSTAHAKGPNDYALFKDTAPRCQAEVWYVADSGHQGLASRHPQTCLPFKKPKGKDLSAEHKQYNHALGRFRIAVEHVIRSFMIWRILKETYRNRRKRFALRFNLIAGLINAGLEHERLADPCRQTRQVGGQTDHGLERREVGKPAEVPGEVKSFVRLEHEARLAAHRVGCAGVVGDVQVQVTARLAGVGVV